MEAALHKAWTAEAFLEADQSSFGPAWRYELVDDCIVSHAAPAPAHGAILAGLVWALGARMDGHKERCRPEIGSGAAPIEQQKATARIPDATIRCGDLPRVLFEVVSPSELRAWRARDRKRRDLQGVAGVMEIVEIYQDEPAIHVYRRDPQGAWSFDAVGGISAELHLPSVGLTLPLAEIYKYLTDAETEAGGSDAPGP